jgi:hypothetical protein
LEETKQNDVIVWFNEKISQGYFFVDFVLRLVTVEVTTCPLHALVCRASKALITFTREAYQNIAFLGCETDQAV